MTHLWSHQVGTLSSPNPFFSWLPGHPALTHFFLILFYLLPVPFNSPSSKHWLAAGLGSQTLFWPAATHELSVTTFHLPLSPESRPAP